MLWRSMRRKPWWLAGAGAVLVCTGLMVALLRMPADVPKGTPSTSQLDTLHARCVQDMVANTCKVMGTGAGAASSAVSRPGELVFIAGVGSVTAADYQQMYAAGDAMCNVVRAACARDWAGSQCDTARKIFGG